MDNILNKEQLNKLQEITTNVINDKTFMFIKNDCECKVYIYDDNNMNKSSSCTMDWYFFLYEILIPKMFGENYISNLKIILTYKSLSKDFHPIDYLWAEYQRLFKIKEKTKTV